ncbi:MAG TPA: hypothetical protein VKQ52_12035 [Puia sp.]|nr:hypothetical protein [Puia sp.]
MKKNTLLVLLLLSFFFSRAQSHGYGMIRAVDFNYGHTDPALGGMFSFGVKGKVVGAGVGTAILHIPGSSSPYFPVFGELNFYTDLRQVRPILNLQAGYGIYSQDLGFGVTEKGGLYLGPNLGLLFPMAGRTAFLFSVGYVRTTLSVSAGGESASASTDGWSVSAGLKF